MKICDICGKPDGYEPMFPKDIEKVIQDGGFCNCEEPLHPGTEAELLEKIKKAIRGYHYALSNRENGNVAGFNCLSKIQNILRMTWND